MTNTDNIDRFGHCVLCHKNMITKRIVDGKEIEMFLPDHDHTDFLLDSGSLMKVCMCKTCKRDNDFTDIKIHSAIMDACHKGWELETKMLVANEKEVQWTQEFADNYLSEMAKYNIVYHVDNIDKTVVATVSKELAESFREVQKINIDSLKEVEIVSHIDS